MDSYLSPKVRRSYKKRVYGHKHVGPKFLETTWLFKNFNYIVFSSNGQKQLHRQLYILQKPIARARRNALYYTYNIYNLFMLKYIWGNLELINYFSLCTIYTPALLAS